MSPDVSRRNLLQGTAVAGVGGVVGYYVFLTGNSGDESGWPYGIKVENNIKASDFEATRNVERVDAEPVEQEPATITLRGERVVAGAENEAFYERTVEVPTNSTRTLDEKFPKPSGGGIFSLTATMEPIVENDNTTRFVEREDSTTFKPGEYGTPNMDPIEVRVRDTDDSHWLVPQITIFKYDR